MRAIRASWGKGIRKFYSDGTAAFRAETCIMSNMDRLAKAGVDPNVFSPEEKKVVESLSQEELDVVMRVQQKLQSAAPKTHGEARLASPKII